MFSRTSFGLAAFILTTTAAGAGDAWSTSVAEKVASLNDIIVVPEGARLRSGVQGIEGQVTSAGLKIVSLDTGSAFCIKPHALGRGEFEELSADGHVDASEEFVRLVRPVLTEEYRVSCDGVRQDFVISQSPKGFGELRLRLRIAGAECETFGEGIKLVLAASGREIAYQKLKVTDARGKTCSASMQAVSGSMIEIVVADAGADYPLRIDPTFSDADWQSLNPDVLGVNGTAFALSVAPNGDIYAGGSFTRAGSIFASNVARWDGDRWWPLGAGVNGEVRALLCMGSEVYAGGSFTTAGGQSASRIARWDGSAWHALGNGMNDAVTVLASLGTDVYAAGDFSTAGGIASPSIARWNGTQWSALGSGVNGFVDCLLGRSGVLYVGGTFTEAGGVSSNAVAAWNGTSWQAMAGLQGQRVVSLVWHDGALLAGRDGSEPFFNLARWDGSQWQEDGPSLGMFGMFYSLISSGSKLWLTNGQFVTEYLPAAQSWAVVATLHSEHGFTSAQAIATTGGDLLIGGGFIRLAYPAAGGGMINKHHQGVSRWNGSQWSPLTKQLNGPLTAITTTAGGMYVAGDFSTIGGQVCNRISRWDGSVWSAMGAGLDFEARSIVVAGGEVYAGGARFDLVTSTYDLRISRWDGNAWASMTGLAGWEITQLIWHNGSLHAAGLFVGTANSSIAGVARWDGSAWQPLAEGLDGVVNALVVHQGSLFAGGDIRIRSGSSLIDCGRLAIWNGTAWQAASGAGFNNEVLSLCVHQGQLIAGGRFTSNAGQPLEYLGRWNGSSWVPFGLGPTAAVSHLVSAGGNLYSAESDFTDTSQIRRWDGANGYTIGSPISVYPGYIGKHLNTMTSNSTGQLLIGGAFFEAGDTWSPYFIQANVPGTTLNSQETWRQTYFGTFGNTGNAADLADFDGDGLPNLIEYAFGLNPTLGVSRALPAPQVSGASYVVSFTQPIGVNGVTYGVEWSSTLAPGSWASVLDTGVSPQHTFSVPLSGNSPVFIRLKVAAL